MKPDTNCLSRIINEICLPEIYLRHVVLVDDAAFRGGISANTRYHGERLYLVRLFAELRNLGRSLNRMSIKLLLVNPYKLVEAFRGSVDGAIEGLQVPSNLVLR